MTFVRHPGQASWIQRHVGYPTGVSVFKLSLWSFNLFSILWRHRRALQFPVPTPMARRRASKVERPLRIASMIVPAVTPRQMQTFFMLSINLFCVSKTNWPYHEIP